MSEICFKKCIHKYRIDEASGNILKLSKLGDGVHGVHYIILSAFDICLNIFIIAYWN